VLLDHHVEELLAALNELGRLYGGCSVHEALSVRRVSGRLERGAHIT